MLNIVNYFREKLHLKCLTGFWIRIDNDLKLGPETKQNRRDKKSSLKARWDMAKKTDSSVFQGLLHFKESISS